MTSKNMKKLEDLIDSLSTFEEIKKVINSLNLLILFGSDSDEGTVEFDEERLTEEQQIYFSIAQTYLSLSRSYLSLASGE